MSKKNFSILLIIGLIFLFGGFNQSARAGSGDNVSGWAWSENIGWISFNNTSGGGSINYGVNVDSLTGIFSGYAWSENIGWISFNQADLTGCPSGTCQAKLDFSTNQVSGWARVLAYGGGWDGWIRLRDTNYGVWRDISVTPNEFRDWAWSDMVIGWISFNCKNQGVCATSNYQVIVTNLNSPPQASDPNETQESCAWGTTPQVAPGLAITLNWTYSDPDGNPQTAYEIWLDDSSTFSDPKFNNLVEHSPLPGPSFSSKLNLADDDNSDWLSNLNWNTTYYWKVRIRDEKGAWSNWSSTDSFTTPLHASPSINFSWAPQRPAVNEIVQLTDLSEVYGGSTKFSWYWTFQDGIPSSSIKQNATTTFTSFGPKTVTLKVTDSDGFNCTGQKTVNARLPLPEWREIIPK